MDRRRFLSPGRVTALALALLLTLGGACTLQINPGPGDAPTADKQTDALQQRVVALETRAAAQQGELGALRTAVAAMATRTATPPPPTPTPVPKVTGLPVSGTTKGVAGAKVTLTEYTDFL